MKSQKIPAKKPEPKFPCLMEYKERTFVVLFHAHGRGIVVHIENSRDYQVGHYSEAWAMQQFVSYDGAIQLQNEETC